MGDAVERGLECQKTMDGKESKSNGFEKEIPSCCLKAMASAPELEANCHSTVVSGWFSASQTRSGHYQLFKFIFLYVCPHIHLLTTIYCFIVWRLLFTGKSGEVVYFNNPMWPGDCYSCTCSYLCFVYYCLVRSELKITVGWEG
jgi:hypothetical protein